MLQIKTTGVDEVLSGSANIKSLIIGGPGAGKTRMSSYWPKPIYLDAENGRGSLADRAMPYVEIKNSKDMLDALEYLKGMQRVPKGQRQFQTVVVDTIDSFQRLVKDEWVQKTQSASFSGYDAWGYLDAKMGFLTTRLLNLDFNVVVLSHYKDKTFKDGENTTRELSLQLQGAIADQIFNDFDLVGWLGTYWAAGDQGRVQKRGLTFLPTPDKPFLKDRFNVTPPWWEITFSDNDYRQIFEAFYNRPELEEMPETEVVGEIPDCEAVPPPAQFVSEGGPLPPKPTPEVPLEKKLRDELMDMAKGLGLKPRGNALKDELVTAIKQAQVKPASEPPPAETAGSPPSGDGAGLMPPASSPNHTTQMLTNLLEPVAEGDTADQQSIGGDQPSFAGVLEGLGGVKPDPPVAEPTGSSTNGGTPDSAYAQPASPEPSSPSEGTSSGQLLTKAPPLTVEQAVDALGATVIAEVPADAPSVPQTTTPPTPPPAQAAPVGPSACAECGTDLAAEWADPAKRDYIRLSFVRHRRYLCNSCFAAAKK